MGKVVITLDNAVIHHTKLIRSSLEGTELMFLPPYSPDLNLIEGLWGWLKSNIINNKFVSIIAIIETSIHKFIAEINKAPQITIDRLYLKL